MLQPPNRDGPPPDGSGPPPDGSGPPSGGSGSRDPLGTSAGMALTGGYIYNALAAGNADAVEGELDTLDVCLSHPTPSS